MPTPTASRWPFIPARSGAPVLVIAHRGARAFAPENTLAAIDKAAALGADLVEIDVRETRDHALIVVHDESLDRCSDVRERFPGRASYRVSDFAWDEVRELDAGRWFVAEIERPARQRQRFLRSLSRQEARQYLTPADLDLYRSGTLRHPTLQEALERAYQRGLAVVVEIKPDIVAAPTMAARVVQLVADLGCEDRVIVSSFDARHLVEVRRHSRRLATAVVSEARLLAPLETVRRVDADAYHPWWRTLLGPGLFARMWGRPDRRLIGALRCAGVAVNVWTVNDVRRMRAFVAAGVSGLFTDYPNRARLLAGCR